MPDSAAAKKVPAIPGLLEYRNDQKKLYVRANKTWSLLTQEKEVKIDLHGINHFLFTSEYLVGHIKMHMLGWKTCIYYIFSCKYISLLSNDF